MKVYFLVILSFSLCSALKIRKYRKTQVESYETIEERKEAKSEMQCCTLCSNTIACEGTKFEDSQCSLVRNVRNNTRNTPLVPIWINNEMYTKKSKLLVMNGHPGNKNSKKTEIIDLKEPESKNCITAKFPYGLKSAFYGMIEPDIPMVCGGVDPDDKKLHHDNCAMLVNGQYELSPFKLETKRKLISDSVATINGSLVAVGGKNPDDGELKSVEIVSPYQAGKLADLPYPLRGHCVVTIDENRLIAISGHGLERMQKDTFVYDLKENQWTPSHQLNIGRLFHACEKFQLGKSTVIVVAGGMAPSGGSRDQRTETVEFLDFKSDSGWIFGQSLPHTVSSHVLVTSPSGRGVLSVGGLIKEDGNTTGDIYEMSCNGSLDDCEWVTLKQKLKNPRTNFGAMLIPDNLASELCN